jgi:hypothetical protein
MVSFNKYINRSMSYSQASRHDDTPQREEGKSFLETIKEYPSLDFGDTYDLDLENYDFNVGCDVELISYSTWKKYLKIGHANIPARKCKYWNDCEIERIRKKDGDIWEKPNKYQYWTISYIQFIDQTKDFLYYPSKYMKKNVGNMTYEPHHKKQGWNDSIQSTFISPNIFDTNIVERWRRIGENEWTQVNLGGADLGKILKQFDL